MYSDAFSRSCPALRPASQKSDIASCTSEPLITLPSLPRARARMLAGARSWRAYLSDTVSPRFVSSTSASGLNVADTLRACGLSASWGAVGVANSSLARVWMMVRISSAVYGCVGMMRSLARRSGGMPCAEMRPGSFESVEPVPRMVVWPLLDARMTMGDMLDSSARFR